MDGKGANAENVVGITAKASTNQIASLTQWQDSTGRVVAEVTPNGAIRTRAALQIMGASSGSSSLSQPVVHFRNSENGGADQIQWSMGLDTSSTPPNRNFFIGRVNADQSTNAVLYITELQTWRNAIGLNWPGATQASVSISGFDYSSLPSVLIRQGASNTADTLRIVNSAGTAIAGINADAGLYLTKLSVPQLTLTNTEALPLTGMRVLSPDVNNPMGLFLNARATNSYPDFQLRAWESAYWGNWFFQVMDSQASRSFLTIRRDSGYVGIGNITDMLAPLDIAGESIRLRQPQTPAAANAPGAVGTICWDAGYVYVCVAQDTWKRTALVV